MKKNNAIILKATGIYTLNLFKRAEKLTKFEIWSEDVLEMEIIVPLYMKVNAEESDYIKSVEETYFPDPPQDPDYVEPDFSDIEITKCPTDKELEEYEKKHPQDAELAWLSRGFMLKLPRHEAKRIKHSNLEAT